MGIFIGGDRAWKKRQKGDICISYEWINGDEHMILYPAYRRTGAGAYALPLSVAHELAHSNGHPILSACVQRAKLAAAQMGMDSNSPFVIKNIIDIILDGLPDLVEMPPEPNWKAIENQKVPNVGEISIKVDGETVIEADVPALDGTEA